MFRQSQAHFESVLQSLRVGASMPEERVIDSPQGAHIEVAGREVLNFCANNYLGLANHPKLIEAAHRALDERGFGLSSVRFICGTQDLHKRLERKLSEFLKTEDTILYSSCFDANGGLFETLLGPEDAVISDELNHASIIDGIRLCKARRLRYAHADMDDLERQLKSAADARVRLIATDGVFSMDGDVAPLDRICDLADRYAALVMVDDSHATGFVGPTGRGTPELFGVADRVDVITSTLGKALGGATGGFTSGRGPIVSVLRNRSRPYLFSNTVPPVVAAAGVAAIDLLEHSADLRDRLARNTERFRRRMSESGFQIAPGSHPIVPIMLYDARLAAEFARRALVEGVYVIGFSYPVVPEGKARVRVQVSAAHSEDDLDRAIGVFLKVRRELGIP